MNPLAALPPVTPFTLHVTPVLLVPVTVAVYGDVVPSVTLVAPLTVTLTCGGGGGAVSVTARLCETLESAMLVAVMLTLADCGMLPGAVKRPAGEMVPMEVSPPTIPLTLQLTAVLLLPLTVALYCAEAFRTTLVAPLNVTVIFGGAGGVVSVTVKPCETEGSAWLVAVIVTLDEPGSLPGAL